MRINRYVPRIRQGGRTSGVIKVTVREHDRFRGRAGTKTRFRRSKDFSGPAGQAGINKDPSATRATDKINISKAHRKPAHVRRDSSD
jgi:hypothetical protein